MDSSRHAELRTKEAGLESQGHADDGGTGAAGPVSWSEAELEQAMRDSLVLQSAAQPGEALHSSDLKVKGLYFEQQAAGSDTCGLNALNNLCQRPQFTLADLQKAEAQHARAQEGGQFAQVASDQNVPTGFFDMEALKIAASTAELEIVDVEPIGDFRRSQCLAFSDCASQCTDGSWFLGFLVYDARPGHIMHYYALRRDERYQGVWLKLDSQAPDTGEEPRNRRLTAEQLWSLYEANKQHFAAWLMRWYPVVYRAGAAREVRTKLQQLLGYDLSDPRARTALQKTKWVVTRTVEHLLKDLPTTAIRELLVQFARPSEAEMRCALETANWDLGAAQPEIDKVLRHRISLAQGVTTGMAQKALSLCDWEPAKAATLLSLQLQCGPASADVLGDLHAALKLTGNDVDQAKAVINLVPAVESMEHAAALFMQMRTWSVEAARRVLQVRKRFPRVPVNVAQEVLRRNDDDPHAACEMLDEYQKRVQRLVLQHASEDLLFKNEEISIAETALNSTDWDPNVAFTAAKNLTLAVQHTRKLIKNRGFAQFFPVDTILPALTAGEMKPQAAASYLLGVQFPMQDGQPQPPPRAAREKRAPAQPRHEEEDTCSIS